MALNLSILDMPFQEHGSVVTVDRMSSSGSNAFGSKAHKEKMRRDKLNDRHLNSITFIVFAVLVLVSALLRPDLMFSLCPLKVSGIEFHPQSWKASQN